MASYFESGFSVREPMWHGLGMVADRYPTDWQEAREWAGLLWEPTVVPAYVKYPIKAGERLPDGEVSVTGKVEYRIESDPADPEETVTVPYAAEDMVIFVESRKGKLVLRDDTMATIGQVGDTWSPMYHSWMGEIIEALSGETNVKFTTAGSVKEGANVWALLELDEPVHIAGEASATKPFLALLNSHDGTGAVKVLYTGVRVVCWNTYSMASIEGDRTGHQYVFRHQGDMRQKVEAAKEALAGLRSQFSEWVELAETLAKVPVDASQVRSFTEVFLPIPVGEVVSDRVKANVAEARAVYGKLYNESPSTEGHRDTALGLFDAAVEYLDHVRVARSKDTLMNRTLLRPEPMKRAALGLLAEITDLDLPVLSRR